MTNEAKFRLNGVVTLLFAAVVGAGSAWFSHQARSIDDPLLRCDATGTASHLFTLTIAFVIIAGLEFQRAKNPVARSIR
jgi:hypothetical protein